MNNTKPTQADRVIRYMEEHGNITSLDAIMDLGVMRLASRISEIRLVRNIPVYSKFITVKNRFGENCQVKAYSLKKEEEAC